MLEGVVEVGLEPLSVWLGGQGRGFVLNDLNTGHDVFTSDLNIKEMAKVRRRIVVQVIPHRKSHLRGNK